MKVIRRSEGPVAVVQLNDPDRRNAISLEMVSDLKRVLASVADEPDVRALVVTGRGDTFCSGADRGVLREADERSLRAIYDAFVLVRDFPLPTIAAVNGPAVGAGLNLALACDVRIAGASAVFDSRFVHIPIHPGGGHTWMLHRATDAQVVAATVMFGTPLDAEEAVRVGLAWQCVDDAELLGTATSMARRVANVPRSLLTSIKRTTRDVPELSTHSEATEVELARQLASIDTDAYRHGIAAAR
ncbi:enoyl-CoA hydratase-related protein [Nocardioides astragali]|uniref:Enoyl-CoA hydratase-related protein n=1 Tax=Nocardioides astragali TaxID=1776736 RepID=A0ABW2N592_9ACTN|nr:enoyl-CoA hydratase-related protein [Nocardioides astragali]